jgi:hypothetical protein
MRYCVRVYEVIYSFFGRVNYLKAFIKSIFYIKLQNFDMVKIVNKAIGKGNSVEYIVDGLEMVLIGLDGLTQHTTGIDSLYKLKKSLSKIKMMTLKQAKDDIEAELKDRKRKMKRKRNQRYYMKVRKVYDNKLSNVSYLDSSLTKFLSNFL